jgi:hypothetical protein
MNERIVYTNAEGGVSVVVPSGEVPIGDLLTSVVPAGVTDAEVVDVAEVPSDRTFRNAWKKGEQGKKVGVDMVKAKALSHDKRRAKRAAEFAPLDIESTIPSKAVEAEGKRQVIRDKHAVIQADIDAATTPEELKAIIVAQGL